jgi:hypothetical protein
MHTRPRRSALLFLAALAIVLVLGTPAAGAHSSDGELTLTKVEQTGPTSVDVEVGIVYANDGHLAEGATVTATLTGPGGATVGPVDLTRTGETTSLYAATVEVSAVGDWTVAVTSTDPTGEVSGSVAVAEGFAGTTTTEAPDAAATDGGETPEPVTATDDPDPAEEAAADATEYDGDDGDDGDDSGVLTGPVVAASLALFAVVIVGGVLYARRLGRAEAAGDDA